MIVFVVQHVHVLDENDENIKFIGVFSSREKAEEAIACLRLQPGFKETPDGFHIDKYAIDALQWAEGYVTSPRK